MSYLLFGYEFGKRQPVRRIDKTPLRRIVDEQDESVYPIADYIEPESYEPEIECSGST